MPSETLEKVGLLVSFLEQHGGLHYALPGSENFPEFKKRTFRYNPAIPLAIIRPQNAEQVASLVKCLASNKIPFTVRTGGNNQFSKSVVHDTVTIDMRDISYCTINSDKESASIGGGILQGDLIKTLEKYDLVTASGTVPWVGYTGWATYGGYGPLAGKFGLGFEQILAAKVVNWKGEVIEAPCDLLKGIKGAGGSFGVIVEMTIKTYPLKHLLHGNLYFDDADIRATTLEIFTNLQQSRNEGWPPQLCIAPLFICIPHGKMTACHVMWSDEDHETGNKWIERVSKLAKMNEDTVRKTTFFGATRDFDQDFAPAEGAHGSVYTINIYAFTNEVIDVIARNMELMPHQFGSGFAVHIAPQVAGENLEGSVFGAWEPHYLLEILCGSPTREGAEEAGKWARTFLAQMKKTNPSNILPSTYISLTPPGHNSLKNIFGPHFGFVRSLKEKYDPEGVFDLAVPFSYLQ